MKATHFCYKRTEHYWAKTEYVWEGRCEILFDVFKRAKTLIKNRMKLQCEKNQDGMIETIFGGNPKCVGSMLMKLIYVYIIKQVKRI